MDDDFIVTPDGTPASRAQPVRGDPSTSEVEADDDAAPALGSGFVGFGGRKTSAEHGDAPGPVSVCDALTENFTLDVFRVDQNRLSAAVRVAPFFSRPRTLLLTAHRLIALCFAPFMSCALRLLDLSRRRTRWT